MKRKMIVYVRGRAFHISLRRVKGRDFEKEGGERVIWRHQYPDPLDTWP